MSFKITNNTIQRGDPSYTVSKSGSLVQTTIIPTTSLPGTGSDPNEFIRVLSATGDDTYSGTYTQISNNLASIVVTFNWDLIKLSFQPTFVFNLNSQLISKSSAVFPVNSSSCTINYPNGIFITVQNISISNNAITIDAIDYDTGNVASNTFTLILST